MKILKKAILISILILYVLSIKSFASSGKVNIEATRIRKENNTTSEILTVIYKNDEVEVLETSGEWLKIKYKEHTGYVKKQYINIDEKTSNELENKVEEKNQVSVYDNKENTESKESTKIKLQVNSRLRLLPNVMSKKTDELVAGIELTIREKMGNWINVTDGTISGWILETKVTSTENKTNVSADDIEKTSNNTNTNSNTNSNTTNTVENEKNKLNTNQVKNETSSNLSMTDVSKKGTINVETAKVRKEPSTSAPLIEFLDYGDEVTITKETGDWYYVNHKEIEGYVNKRLITIVENQVSSRGLNEERKNITSNTSNLQNEAKEEIKQEIASSNSTGEQVVNFAKQYLNYSYVLGGKTPESGFDCSGFTRYVYKNFGYSLASTAAGQTDVGREVSRVELLPGDLILFYNEGKTKIGHTGIYLGNDEFIHSANPQRGVVIDKLSTNSYYNERYVLSRRIVE